MDFVFKNGLGLRKKNEPGTIVNVDNCAIADPKINKLLSEVKENFKDVDKTYLYCVIRTPSNDSSISFVLNENSSKLKEAIEKITEFASKTSAKNVLITKSSSNSISSDYFVVKGKDMLEEEYLGKKFLYSIQGFFQNNYAVASKMQQYVHDLLKKYKTSDKHLLDLYGGVGTFGIVNASLFKSMTTIEGDENCTKSALENIKLNKVNGRAIFLDAAKLKRVKLETPLFVITDPPRSGMDEKTIIALKELKPSVIVYISCNVQQLAKDVKKFKQYELKSAAMFDLFPQTTHIEAVVELVRKAE
jgi:23S rRNA (uracil1939-C5)-methyltransferase